MSKSVDIELRKLIKQIALVGIGVACIGGYSKADVLSTLIEQVKPRNKVLSFRIWSSSIYTRLIIETTYFLDAKTFNLDNPQRLVLDLDNLDLNNVLKNVAQHDFRDDPLVKQVRVSQFNSNVARCVVDLHTAVVFKVQQVSPINVGSAHYKFRYIVDLYNAKEIKNDKNIPDNDDLLALIELNDAIDQNNNQQQLTNKSDKIIKENSSNVEKSGRRASHPELKPILTNPATAKSQGKILVMIDPGHGGEDPGAIGHMHTKEKAVVLKIATQLYEMINSQPHMQAKMTRRQDIFIPLGVRVALARQARADIFVSIHADAFTTPQASGSSVFMLSDKGASSSFAKWLARTQNASDEIGGINFNVHNKIVNRVLLDMTQSLTRKRSDQLSRGLLNQLALVNHLHNHQVESAAFAVLKAPDIPSVLVETAFISNLHEEEQLQTQHFRDKIANSLLVGIDNFAKTLLS